MGSQVVRLPTNWAERWKGKQARVNMLADLGFPTDAQVELMEYQATIGSAVAGSVLSGPVEHREGPLVRIIHESIGDDDIQRTDSVSRTADDTAEYVPLPPDVAGD